MIDVREYGADGPWVIVLHGGPAAAGSAGPLARGLGSGFHVLEPWQRTSGVEPLTVARHIADLDEVIRGRCAPARPALVGESWGAMLALACAAAHPDRVSAVVLVGCGTFDLDARARLRHTLEERTTPELRAAIARLESEIADPLERMKRTYVLTHGLYDWEPVNVDDPADAADATPPPFDIRAHQEAWDDMLRLQREGVYPAAFSTITCPVLMLHGDWDPHPGDLIHRGLLPHLPQLECRHWAECGHRPWAERAVRDDFFATLRQWLLGQASQSPPTA